MAQFAVELSYKIDSLARELAKVEGETRAGALKTAKTRVLAEEKANDAIRVSREKANRAMGESGRKAGHDTSKSIKEFADQAGDADSILKGLGGSLGTLSDDADKAAGTFGEVFAGLESVAKVGAKLGPVGAAGAAGIAALGGAYAALSYELDQAIARQEEAAKTADAAATAHRAFEDAVLDLDVAVGNLTESERRNIKLRQQAAGVYDDQKKALREQITAAEDAGNANSSLTNSARDFVASYTPYGLLMESTAERAERFGKKADSLRNQLANLERGTANLADKLIETADQEDKNTESKRRATEATRRQAEATRAAEQAEKEHAARLKDLGQQLAALERANADAEDASKARLTARNAELSRLEADLSAEGMLTAEAADEILVGRLNAEHAYQDEQDKLRAEREAAAKTEADKAIAEADRVAAEKAKIEQQQWQAAQQYATAALDAIGVAGDLLTRQRIADGEAATAALQDQEANLTDAQRQQLKAREAAGKRAALRSFRLSQSVGIAEALISGTLASIAALRPPPVGLGPVLGPALAITTGLATVGTVAGIAATPPPKAHSGYQDERVTTVQQGEAILSRTAVQGMGGPGAVRAMNQGSAPAQQGSSYAVIRMDSRTIGEAFVQSSHTPRVRAITQGRGRPGQRLRT